MKKIEITKQLINSIFEVEKLKEIEEQLKLDNNIKLLNLIKRKLAYNKWELIWANLGTPENNLNNNIAYTKSQIINNLKGINIGVEFSLFHPAIIISPYFLNKEKVTIIPITSLRNHNCNYDNLYSINGYELLNHNSVALIDQIKTISIKRIIRHKKKSNNKEVIIYINKQDKNNLIKKISKVFL